MALNDVYEVIDRQLLYGQQILNVWFYQYVDETAGFVGAESVAYAFEIDILPSVCAIQTASIAHTGITVRNLFNPSDRFDYAISEPGTRSSGDAVPPFVAVNYSLTQNNGLIRNGSKRFGGLDEGDMTNGVITSAPLLTALTTLNGKMSETIGEGTATSLMPVIVKRILSAGKYLLPDTLAGAVIGEVIDAVYDTVVTSQVSRKIGKGM